MTTKATPAAARTVRHRAGKKPVKLDAGLRQGLEMDCAVFEREFEAAARRENLPAAARAHLALCRHCQDMVEDFSLIAERVRQLAVTETIPDMWPEIREQLRREGIIHNGHALAPRLVRRRR